MGPPSLLHQSSSLLSLNEPTAVGGRVARGSQPTPSQGSMTRRSLITQLSSFIKGGLSRMLLIWQRGIWAWFSGKLCIPLDIYKSNGSQTGLCQSTASGRKGHHRPNKCHVQSERWPSLAPFLPAHSFAAQRPQWAHCVCNKGYYIRLFAVI